MGVLQPVRGNANFILDNSVETLEQKAREYVDASHCMLVERACDGISMALGACGIGSGDEVFCTPFGHDSTLWALRKLGARPVFVDVNPNSYNMDAFCLEYVIRKRQRELKPIPRALVATDLFGLPCDYAALGQVCAQYGIHMVEDMQGAFGAWARGGKAGSWGRFAVASFFETDPGGSLGSDGAVFSSDENDDALLRILRGDGAVQQVLRGDWASGEETCRIRVQNILLEKMVEGFDRDIELRSRIAGWYTEQLQGHIGLQVAEAGFSSAWTQMAVALRNSEHRALVLDRLTAEQIPCRTFCSVPLHRRMDKGAWDRVILVNAERLCERILLLPMHPHLSKNVVEHICSIILETLSVQTDS